MTITWYKRCLCITELTGIGVELPSSELELNCLRDFVPESELNWKWYYRNWNWIAKTELTPTLRNLLSYRECCRNMVRKKRFAPGQASLKLLNARQVLTALRGFTLGLGSGIPVSRSRSSPVPGVVAYGYGKWPITARTWLSTLEIVSHYRTPPERFFKKNERTLTETLQRARLDQKKNFYPMKIVDTWNNRTIYPQTWLKLLQLAASIWRLTKYRRSLVIS